MGIERKTFGQLLKGLRESRELTQERLAELTKKGKDGKARLSRVQINRLENDLHEPTWKTIKLLCEVLNVECAIFMEAAETARDAEQTKPAPNRKKGKGA
jgi:transcriptional regulator with XRE-family HTH domain